MAPSSPAAALLLLIGSVASAAEFQRFGDQLLAKDQLRMRVNPGAGVGVNRPQLATGFTTYRSERWPQGNVPVQFAETISEPEQRQFLAACAQWSSRARVRCVLRTKERDYLSVLKADGCWSTVGFVKGGGRLSLGDGCWDTGVILHELGHALGIMHEHQRADRDRFITINWDNIEPQWASAYVPLDMDNLSNGNPAATPYDFGSIMHYGNSFFGNGAGPTFSVNAGYEKYANDVGRQQNLSALDGQGMNYLYSDRYQAGCAPAKIYVERDEESIARYCAIAKRVICTTGYPASITCTAAPGWKPHGANCAEPSCAGCGCSVSRDE